jgi:FkbM family methyltransferase
MMKAVTTNLYEFLRCTRHNALHLELFRVSYRRGCWLVRDGQLEMKFPWYPYLAFRDIEGYIKGGDWRPKTGETVVDVGGCFGEFTLYASRCVGPTGRVVMLEPDPGNLARAKELFALNGSPSNIEIVTAGLWGQPGKLRFQTGLGGESAVLFEGSSSRVADDGEADKIIKIDVHSLSSLADSLQLKRLDFVKMDVEGAELEIITGASSLPSHLKPRYSIASYHIVNGIQTAKTLAEMFPRIGYEAAAGFPNHLTTWAVPTKQPSGGIV